MWMVIGLIVLVFALAGGLLAVARPALRGGAGFISHTLCAEMFISGLSQDRALAESIHSNPVLRILKPVTSISVDVSARAVRVSILGMFRSTAVDRGDLGCLITNDLKGSSTPATLARARSGAEPFPGIDDRPVGGTNPKLIAALDRAFADDPKGVTRNTRAVVVVKDGALVAERYAAGITPEMPLLGYSMAKSFTNAMLGVLSRQGRLDIKAHAPVAEWQSPGDPRRAITVEQLMRMTSGLSVGESHSGLDGVTRMLYTERDMGAFARAGTLQVPPGTRYAYTSGDTLILSSIMRDILGSGSSVIGFAHAELFDPLGMRTPILELDATGTPIGSTYLLASARDWARFGMLYANDGVVAGRRILPEHWVTMSVRQTLNSEYGAGFRPVSIPQTARKFDMIGLPEDAFFAVGYLGQYTVIIPSRKLVIVRLGATFAPIGSADGVGQLVRDVLASMEGVRDGN